MLSGDRDIEGITGGHVSTMLAVTVIGNVMSYAVLPARAQASVFQYLSRLPRPRFNAGTRLLQEAEQRFDMLRLGEEL
jgi:hypothetical protein